MTSNTRSRRNGNKYQQREKVIESIDGGEGKGPYVVETKEANGAMTMSPRKSERNGLT